MRNLGDSPFLSLLWGIPLAVVERLIVFSIKLANGPIPFEILGTPYMALETNLDCRRDQFHFWVLNHFFGDYGAKNNDYS